MASAIFSGNSRYASDFASVIDRAVAIASLPLTQLQAEKARMAERETALNALSVKFAALGNAATGLEAATGLSSYSTSVSDSAAIRETVSAGALEGTYSVEVVSLGANTNTMSADGLAAVADPAEGGLAAGSEFRLSVDGEEYAFHADNLMDMAAAINGSGLDVRASVVNVGGTEAPDYRLSVQAKTLGAAVISLKVDAEGAAELLDTLSTGSLARYKVNGVETEAVADSRTVTLAPGVTLDLLKQTDEAVAITVSRTPTGMANAVSSFVNAFNAAVGELDKHRGQDAGALAGESVVYTLSQSLRDLGGWSGRFPDFGLGFSDQGKLVFDSAAFSRAASADMDAALEFLGSAGGGGFLGRAAGIIGGMEETSAGAVDGLMRQIATQDDRIATNQARIDDLRASLESQIAAADALIASLEQQALYYNGLFESMREASKSYA